MNFIKRLRWRINAIINRLRSWCKRNPFKYYLTHSDKYITVSMDPKEWNYSVIPLFHELSYYYLVVDRHGIKYGKHALLSEAIKQCLVLMSYKH